MAVKPLNRDNLMHFVERLRALDPETRPQWGEMSPAKMVRHLRRVLEIAMGRVDVPDESNFFTRTLLKPLVVHVLPFPKGVKTPPDFTPEPEGDLTTEREALLVTVDEFLAALEEDPERVIRNPFFGPMSMPTTAKLQGKHFRHHLRQFGV